MRYRMGADRDATSRLLAELVPVHRRQLFRIVAGKLGDRQRRANERVPRADEDLDWHSEPFQVGNDGGRAPKGVIEGDAHLPKARQGSNLPQQEIGLDCEPVLPIRRDGVVTEDERLHAGARPDD